MRKIAVVHTGETDKTQSGDLVCPVCPHPAPDDDAFPSGQAGGSGGESLGS